MLFILYYVFVITTTHQVEGKSMADNDCYGGQHFPLVAEDPAQSCRCFGMLRCSGGQASHQVYQGQMCFDQGHKSSACGGDQVDSHVDGQVGVGNPIQLGGGDVLGWLRFLRWLRWWW